MAPIINLLHTDFSVNIALSLLHTLWQGTIIAGILFFVLKNIAGNRSELRYRLSLFSLFTMILCWLCTFSILQYQTSLSNDPTIAAEEAIIQMKHASAPEISTTPLPKYDSGSQPAGAVISARAQYSGSVRYAGWAVLLWAAGVCVMLARMFRALAGAARLKRDATEIDDFAITELFGQLCKRMNMRGKIRLAASKTLVNPGVIGFFRPVLLIPLSILSEISPDDLQAILAHELAHIRRLDYLVNFCQMAVEAVLFFNPAVWWVSRRIRIEREACCDVAAVAAAGHRVRYANVLFEQIARIAPPQPASPAGFCDNAADSEERIHRIVHPHHKPSMKVGWMKAACSLAVTGIVLIGLYKTTDLAVAMAAQIMSPQERIEKISEIKNEYMPDYEGPATIEISGTVSTFDGKTPENWRVHTVSGHTHASIGSPGCDPDSDPKTTFEGKLYSGKSYLYAVCDGYAPFITEIELEQGEALDGIEVIFDHGFNSKLRVVDQNGNPVAGAAVSWRLTAADSTFGDDFESVSGVDGFAVFEKVIRWPVSVKVIASGYQKVEGYKIELKPDEVETVVLNKAVSSAGTVVSRQTGKPIADAKVRIVYKDAPGHGWGYGIRSDVAAVSDTNGVFVLDTLEAGATYSVMVSSSEHRDTFVSNIVPGNMNLKIEMAPAVTVNARITGDLSKLSQGWHTVNGERVKGPQINVNFVLKEVRGLYNDFQYYPVIIEDGIGYVHIEHAIGSRLDFQIDGKTVYKLDIIDGKSQYDIIMDTSGPPERDVVITFTAGQEMPLPEGQVWVSGRPDGDSEWYSHNVTVENGIAAFTVPAPCTLSVYSNNADMLTGYWFVPVGDIEIEPSDEPFEFEINVEPGGTIFGSIYDAQGNKVNGARISIQLANGLETLDVSAKSRIGDSIRYDAGKSGSYSAMSLPFGGKYKLEAVHEHYVMPSPDIEISETIPIIQHDFRKGRSITLKGQILKHDSSAAAGIDYQLHRSSTLVSGSLSEVKTANKNGEFVIEGVNPDAKAEYSLKVYDKETGRQEKFVLNCTQRSQTLKLSKPILIKGRVINADTTEGISGLSVFANTTINNHTDYSVRGNGVTDNDGYFEIYVSSGDSYNVGIDHQSLRSFHGNNASSMSIYSKRIESSDETVLFEVRPVNTLSGQVIDASTGQPIAGAKISGVLWITESHKSNSKSFSPVTDGEGKFQLPPFEGVAYEIEEIKGYYFVSEQMINFKKGERDKTLVLKVKQL